jgi:hypothetical protein
VAQKIIYADDIDGSEGAETIRFAYKGQAYEIDLSPKNLEKLDKALAPYIEKGRAAGSGYQQAAPRQRRSSATAKSGDKVDYATLEHAGEIHRGRVTEAEAAIVRDNLDEVNARLASQGRPTIDPNDTTMKKRYGF